MNCSVSGQWSSKIGPVTPCSRSVTWFEFRYLGEWSDSQIIVIVLNLKCTGSGYKSCEVLLHTHSPESFRITVNCSCDREQDHEDTMMGSHPGDRVTACSVRCSILEYLMEMMVIFISPLGLSLSGRTNYRVLLFRVEKLRVISDRSSKVIGSILRTSDRPSRNIDRVISGHLRSGVSLFRGYDLEDNLKHDTERESVVRPIGRNGTERKTANTHKMAKARTSLVTGAIAIFRLSWINDQKAWIFSNPREWLISKS
ncbi:hypothetical protein IGI04_039227 [Brassica rapa subsp. trilocularis]|uniref:Uncharacterized protein n=1 Tax=Brassica rapa subsp. trilocularis TaxID=1813537 RepID=A0ABQ7KNC7_BRACM|nr:hypothetical protein IGI04_039227 [Brassica rapa subsp. trilocularis]